MALGGSAVGAELELAAEREPRHHFCPLWPVIRNTRWTPSVFCVNYVPCLIVAQCLEFQYRVTDFRCRLVSRLVALFTVSPCLVAGLGQGTVSRAQRCSRDVD